MSTTTQPTKGKGNKSKVNNKKKGSNQSDKVKGGPISLVEGLQEVEFKADEGIRDSKDDSDSDRTEVYQPEKSVEPVDLDVGEDFDTLTITEEEYKPKKTRSVGAVSKVFVPFRAVGYVCNRIPFSVQVLGDNTFILTCVGDSFHIYNNAKLNVVMVGKPTPEPITAMTVRRENTFVANGNKVIKFRRTHPARTVTTSKQSGYIYHLEIFGEHVMCLSTDNYFQLLEIKTLELYTSIEFPTETFRVSCLLHPDTYLNKVVFGSWQGGLQLWNIKARKLIYTFPSFQSPIVCLSQSPVVDVIGVGLFDGTIVLYNLRLAKRIFSFKQNGKVTAITFRTDDHHHMATASTNGDITVWDLEERKLFHTIYQAHADEIASIKYLNNQPLLISSSGDNALKQWLFDTHDGLPRLYRSRTGHFLPPTMVKYQLGNVVLSTGQDSTLRKFAVYNSNKSTELTQGKIQNRANRLSLDVAQLRMPVVTDFATNLAKRRQWADLVTCHIGSNQLRTWHVANNSIGDKKLQIPDKEAVAKSCTITHCGNYALVGTDKGTLYQFNLQSGNLRKASSVAHLAPVTSILSDRSNLTFVTASLDGTLKIWDLSKFELIKELNLNAPIAKLINHLDNSLVAAACDDHTLQVIDLDTLQVVRRFQGFSHRITDLQFSPDGRWLVVASLDNTLRTFDIPSGQLIDNFKVPSTVTSLTFSTFGDLLATTHADHLGIFTWSNQTMYEDVTLKALPSLHVPQMTLLPSSGLELDGDDKEGATSSSGSDSEGSDSDSSDDEGETVGTNFYISPDQLTSQMVTLSRAPWSKWQKLLHLDTIQKRNKPINPPKQPELAPFFLTTTQGVNPQFVVPDSDTKSDAPDSRLLSDLPLNLESEFITKVRNTLNKKKDQDFDELRLTMENLSPSQIEVELGLLTVHNNFEQHRLLLEVFVQLLKRRIGFEMIHAYLHNYLKLHGDVLIANGKVFEDLLINLNNLNLPIWSKLHEKLKQTQTLLEFCRRL